MSVDFDKIADNIKIKSETKDSPDNLVLKMLIEENVNLNIMLEEAELINNELRRELGTSYLNHSETIIKYNNLSRRVNSKFELFKMFLKLII